MTDSQIDVREATFRAIYTLPDNIDEDLQLVYQEMIDRLTSESAGLTMTTVQTLLIERMASHYVTIKYKERHNLYATPTQHKDATSQWLDMTKEFNRLLISGQTELREALLKEISQRLVTRVREIKDPDERQKMLVGFAADFTEMGL